MHVTPKALPTGRICKSINIPNSREWLGIFDKLLLSATEEWQWQQLPDGEITVEETIIYWETVLADYWDNAGCAVPDEVPTPYWDEATDLDDTAPAETQTWYGIFDGTFQETVENFVIAGFIAATGEIGGAVFFLTIAPKFRLAWKTGDLGGIIRVFVDAADMGTVDTYSATEGVLEKDYIGDPEVSEHEVMMVLEELPA